MTQERLLADRAAVVVGGSRGIGKAVSELLAACGAGVVINGREPDAARDAAAAITSQGGRAFAHTGSPADEATADALIESCVAGSVASTSSSTARAPETHRARRS